MYFGVLANVERHHVEAESMNAPQQALHGKQPGLLALVDCEAVGDQLYVSTSSSTFS